MRTPIDISSLPVSPALAQRGKERLPSAPTPRMQSKVPIAMMIGFTSSWIVAGYFAQELPAVAVLFSMSIGFAPLIGLCLLLAGVALLISFLICTVERTFADGDKGIVPEPRLKNKWHRATYFPSELLAYCLSLKEHSPPSVVPSY